MTETADKAGAATDLPVLSVTKTRGLMLASERFGKVMHGRNLANYRIAHRRSIVADPMLLWDGAIGLQTVVDAGLVSPDYRVYKPTAEALPEFLALLVRSHHMILKYQDGARGTNVRRNRITRSDFLSIPILLPPLKEQRSIATILSAISEAIEASQSVVDQIRVLKKALMAELLTHGIPGRHTKFKQTEHGNLPTDWDVVLLDSVARRGSGHTPNKNHPEFWNGDVKWVSLKDSSRLDRLYISDTAAHITPLGIANSSAVAHPPGSVVLSRDAGVGKSAIITDTMAVSQHFMAWVCGPMLDNHFLYYVLQFRKPDFERIAIGNTIKTIGLPYFKAFKIPLPSLAEQTVIAGSLKSVDHRLFDEELLIERLRGLKSTMMSALLSGEVRVTPDGHPA